MNVVLTLLQNGIGVMAPILLAATGGLFTEKSGMLNIALEGLMLVGSFFCVVLVSQTGNLLLGLTLGVLVTMVLAGWLGFVTLFLKANVFISGLATNLFASGITVVLAFQIYRNKGVIIFHEIPSLGRVTIPIISQVPVLGRLISGHHVFVYFSWLILVIAWYVLYKTTFGVRLRSVGINDQVLVSLGRNPRNYRMAAFLISGFCCGLAGAILTLSLRAFVPNITAGKGWIALVVIFLGNKRPMGLFIAALVFGFAESLSNYAQGAMNVPADFILALPYALTLIAMIGYSVVTYRRQALE